MPKCLAVIQAGGKGTRMLELTKDRIPKPMLEINGKPMLLWQMEAIADYGIKDFVVIVGHLGEKIKDYFGDGTSFGYNINYIQENEPLGSAGALFFLKEYQADQYLLIFGDVMFKLDLDRMFRFHSDKGSLATLLSHPNSHPYDSDILLTDSNDCVKGILPKNNERKYWYHNCVNAGIYILDKKIIDEFDELKKCDLEKDILSKYFPKGCVYAYSTPEYVKDAGTPERFATVSDEQKRGIWDKKCLKNKQKCVFLDRDGTLNKYKGLIKKADDIELEDSVAEAIKLLNGSGWLTVVVTNQPVIARGECSYEELTNIHNKMETLLGNEGAYLDDIIYCPHHPDGGYEGEIPELKIKCNCRKPATGMIDNAIKKFNICAKHSYIIGDTTRDIQTGKNALLHTILVQTGEAGNDKRYDAIPEYCAPDLLSAVKIILSNEG